MEDGDKVEVHIEQLGGSEAEGGGNEQIEF